MIWVVFPAKTSAMAKENKAKMRIKLPFLKKAAGRKLSSIETRMAPQIIKRIKI